ncbi:MAG TPA: hypothetical protein VMT09_03700 [Steroidobacteraceae bacterium]|nr:hypothetical protein [Steroidobacteraceae bacterium]
MHFLGQTVLDSRWTGRDARRTLASLLGYGRNLVLVAWVIGVLAFCLMGLAGAMR